MERSILHGQRERYEAAHRMHDSHRMVRARLRTLVPASRDDWMSMSRYAAASSASWPMWQPSRSTAASRTDTASSCSQDMGLL